VLESLALAIFSDTVHPQGTTPELDERVKSVIRELEDAPIRHSAKVELLGITVDCSPITIESSGSTVTLRKVENSADFPLFWWSLLGSMLVALSYSTLCHSMDYSLPGFSVRGISQARILGWVAIPCSRGSF